MRAQVKNKIFENLAARAVMHNYESHDLQTSTRTLSPEVP